MSRSIGFKPSAWREFDKAISWYERQEPGLGARFEAEANLLLERVSANPEQFPKVARTVSKARGLNFPYSIYFTISREKIIVIAIHHGSRDPEKLKRRLR
jgi:plasmid stabilization system protein ParE